MTKIEQALVTLLHDIDAGYEFPDAHSRACSKHSLSWAQSRMLIDNYDMACFWGVQADDMNEEFFA